MREALHGDVNGHRIDPSILVSVEPSIRRCTLEDIPWLRPLLQITYGGMVDLDRCEQYYRKTLPRADHLYLRGAMSAVGLMAFVPYWAPLDSRPHASDVFFCAQRSTAALMELALVMREVVEWAKAASCCECRFTALNGADIAALAKRAGLIEQVPMFRAVF